MRKQIEGSRAVAEAVALSRPEVICAYPISPQTHIVEALGTLVKSGELAPCEFINVESEFAAMSVAIGASAAGARAYTATASQGLLFMAEAVYNASGLGLPIVMTVANRAIGDKQGWLIVVKQYNKLVLHPLEAEDVGNSLGVIPQGSISIQFSHKACHPGSSIAVYPELSLT